MKNTSEVVENTSDVFFYKVRCCFDKVRCCFDKIGCCFDKVRSRLFFFAQFQVPELKCCEKIIRYRLFK